MADSTINGLTELGTLKENDLMIAWEADAPTNQTKKITAKNARKFLILEAVCDSAANSTTKNITINANAIPERIAVTFTHGNTAGDTTQQGFTPLKLSIAYNGGSADFDICDSLGNYAGKGFGGGVDGGVIIFQLLSTKALITNSDIRQKETNKTIYADGYIENPMPKGTLQSGDDLNSLSGGYWISATSAIGNSLLNKPSDDIYSCILLQFDISDINKIQVLFSSSGSIYNRRYSATWSSWYKQTFTIN